MQTLPAYGGGLFQGGPSGLGDMYSITLYLLVNCPMHVVLDDEGLCHRLVYLPHTYPLQRVGSGN